MGIMVNKFLLLGFLLLLTTSTKTVYSAPISTAPARIVNGVLSNAVSAFIKWVWSFKVKSSAKTGTSARPLMKFESGYVVETVFDGSKLGIEPYSVEVLPNGELLILDSANSNLYRISSALSLYSRPKLVAGSPDGYSGHVDGRTREARMSNPKGLTVDDRGNIYIADTANMAIRKISDAGVTTIAGGKRSDGRGHVDGPSEDAKFSDDFDVVYIGSSCSLLVIDRGNHAIREIQLHFDDCAYQYESGFPIGIAILVGAGFFGYMLALLQHRVGKMVSSQNDQDTAKTNIASGPYQDPLKSVRPPLIPTEGEQDKQEESFFGSLGNLLVNGGASMMEILGGIFPGFRKKPVSYQYQSEPQQRHSSSWPVQESFDIQDDDEPPSLETRTPTQKKTYAFMTKDADKMHQLRQSRAFYSGLDGNYRQQPQKQQHYDQYQSSRPRTNEQSSTRTGENLFRAVQENDRVYRAVDMKSVNSGDPTYNHRNIRSGFNSMRYL